METPCKNENTVSNLQPVTLESSQIVLENDCDTSNSEEYEDDFDQKIIRTLQNDHVPPKTSTINIEGSSDVVIGPLTQFHGPVTIYQNVNEDNNRLKSALNETRDVSKSENEPAKLVVNKENPSEKHHPRPEPSLFSLTSKSKLIICASFGVAIVLSATITVLAFINQSNQVENPSEQVNDDNKSTIIVGDHLIFTKRDWGGRPSLNFTKPLIHPTEYVIISHTAGGFCDNFENCCPIMQQIQAMHVAKLGSPDIGYNFLIGGDGNIYAGRGWDVRNFHQDKNIGICFIGNYVYDELNAGMISALKELLDLGIKEKKLAEDYKLVCHNQTYSTLSPGQNVYKIVSKLPHFRPGPVRF